MNGVSRPYKQQQEYEYYSLSSRPYKEQYQAYQTSGIIQFKSSFGHPAMDLLRTILGEAYADTGGDVTKIPAYLYNETIVPYIPKPGEKAPVETNPIEIVKAAWKGLVDPPSRKRGPVEECKRYCGPNATGNLSGYKGVFGDAPTYGPCQCRSCSRACDLSEHRVLNSCECVPDIFTPPRTAPKPVPVAGVPIGQKCRRVNSNCQYCNYGGDKKGYCWTNRPCGGSKNVTWCSKGSSSCAQPRDIWIRKYGCKTGTSTTGSSATSPCRRVNSNCVYCNYGGDKKGYCWTNNPCNSSKKVTWCTKGSSSCDKPRSIWISKYGCTGAGFKSGSSGNCSWDTKGGWCWKSTACKKPCKACIHNYKTTNINSGCKKVRSYFVNNSRKCPGCKSSSGSGSGSSGGFRCPYSGCGSTKSKSQCFLCRCRGRCNSAKCGGVKTVKSDGSCFCNRSC